MPEVITKDKIAELPDCSRLKVSVDTIITRAARELIKKKSIELQLIEESRSQREEKQKNDQDIKRGIVTVVGHDRVGIIARVAGILAESNVNILDISQTVLQGFFAMIMIVDLSCSRNNLSELRQKLDDSGEEMGLKITLQHEDVFRYMHRV
ncbi:MAG: ACT domain-containing protein [Thermacetogeniaceae bacterium]|jgi:ACT domain-containing protein|nr:ACT domain-containing protein [Thermoanaerobacterales bacterium]NLN22122.1 ACT domain-containing protein [Syntrophomonadaceae bacterium]HAF17603.1 ACT domain-containing protein [Peptococcaceae bacterium]